MNLNQTPRGERVHIGLFGNTNVGKSSLINSITNQKTSIVSNIKGTTTDPVYKSIEINGIGPCVLIDTAGLDDNTELKELRLKKTLEIIDKIDLAILVFDSYIDSNQKIFIKKLLDKNVPIIAVINKIDSLKNIEEIKNNIYNFLNLKPLCLSSLKNINIEKLIESLVINLKTTENLSLCGEFVNEDDLILLVMPQDLQAPKGRLILPQVQTIRDLLDNDCSVICCTKNNFKKTLKKFNTPPKLIITDSQIFSEIFEEKPKESKITSFSVLFSKYKGDINEFINGAYHIDNLKDGDRVLIAEACSHNPLDGDIARVKLPDLLKKRTKKNLEFDIVSGNNFPEDLRKYSLIIHCGGCMFNKKFIMSRILKSKNQNIPITNYGISIAYIKNILDKIEK